MVESNFNLESFKSGFGNGAKSNLFYYIPSFPEGINSKLGINAMYLVKSTQLPETTLEETLVNWQGYDFKYAGKHTYSDFTISFNVDIKAQIRMAFEDWINKKIHNPLTNKYHYFSEYMVKQRIQLLGYDGEVITEYTLHDAWPKSIGNITLDYSATDIATFEVTFSYSHHTSQYTGTGS